MHALAAQKPDVAPYKINLRLFIPKLLFIPAFAFALVSQHTYAEDGFWDTTWEVLSFLILTIAALGRVWTSAYISGRKNHELVVDGPYSMTRNPLYFFSLLGYLGAGLAFEKLTACVLFVLVFVLTHLPTILREERKLREKFGDKFDAYAATVPRFWPRFRHVSFPETVTFSPKSFNRAVIYSGFIMLVYILAHLIEYGQDAGVIPILFRNVP